MVLDLNIMVTPASSKYGGIVNPFARFNTYFNKNNILKITYHIFQTAQDVTDASNPGQFYEKSLGSEIDMIYTHKLAKGISVKAGYHIAFPTATMEIFKGLKLGESETPQ